METTLCIKKTSDKLTEQSVLHFKQAEIADIPVLSAFLNRYPTRSSDFSIGGIIIWTGYFDYEYAIIDDILILKGRDENGVFFHQPLGGKSETEGMALIRDYCDEHDIIPRIIIPDECQPENMTEYETLHPSYLADWREYVYDIDQFTHFSGKKMEKKRNHLNYFLKHYEGFEVEILDGTQTDELVEFNDRFNLYHKEGNSFDYESEATAEVLRHYDRFPFFGLLIRYKGEILGYTFGEAVGDTFSIHAEKGNIDFRGIYQALSSQLSLRIKEKYPEVKFLNREDDMGNEYLRQSKLSYHPAKFIAKWEISA